MTKARAVDDTAVGDSGRSTVDEINERGDGVPPVMATPTVTTTRTFTQAGKVLSVDERHENLTVQDFFVPPAEVGVELSQTINMGNYESVRIGVSVKLPCYTEELPPAYTFALNFVKDRLKAERDLAADWARKKGSENLF